MLKYLGIVVLALGVNVSIALMFAPQGMSAEGYIIGWGMTLVAIFAGPGIWKMGGGVESSDPRDWGWSLGGFALVVVGLRIGWQAYTAAAGELGQTPIFLGVLCAVCFIVGIVIISVVQHSIATKDEEESTVALY